MGCYLADLMQHDGDRSGLGTPIRFTVAEAAARLGITAEAVRQRIKRDTLPYERENGSVYVLLDADRSRLDGRPNDDSTGDRSELVEVLRAQVEMLRGELGEAHAANRENRRIIAALTSRLPQLEAPRPSEPTESDVSPGPARTPTDADAGSQASSQPRQRSLWRRIFGD